MPNDVATVAAPLAYVRLLTGAPFSRMQILFIFATRPEHGGVNGFS